MERFVFWRDYILFVAYNDQNLSALLHRQNKWTADGQENNKETAKKKWCILKPNNVKHLP